MAELRKKSESTAAKQLANLKKKPLVEYRGTNRAGGVLCEMNCGVASWQDKRVLFDMLGRGLGLMESKNGAYKPLEPTR